MSKLQTTDGNAPQINEFDNDVQEFKNIEKEIVVNFVKGIIQLGEVLKRQRDKWKPQKRWTDYLNSVDKTLVYANQCIRLYEYSVKNMDTILKLGLTNWHKVNMFLALPDELRDKMAETIDGEETTTEEFVEAISEVKDENIEVDEEEDARWQELVSSASFSDLPFMAKEILKQLNQNGYSFSNKCLPVIEGFLGLGKANKELQKENFKPLSKEERQFWKKHILEQLDVLNKLLK